MEALQGYSLTMIVFLTYCTEMYGTVFVWLIKETHQDWNMEAAIADVFLFKVQNAIPVLLCLRYLELQTVLCEKYVEGFLLLWFSLGRS